MPVAAVVAAAAVTAYAANRQAKAAQGAANTQADATRDANAMQDRQYWQTREDNMPALDARNWALGELKSRLQNPNLDVANEPGYQFGLDQGLKAVRNSSASRGGLYSGATLKALDRYGTDYATTKYDAAYNRMMNPLQSLAGLSQSGANSIAAAGQNYANQVGNNQTSLGNALAANTLAQGNIWGTAVNQLGSTLKNSWNSIDTSGQGSLYGSNPNGSLNGVYGVYGD